MDEEEQVALATSSRMRWPLSLVALGIVLFLAAIAGWWGQDALGTLANEGGADMGEVVTFRSTGGTYRVLSSGPLRPAPSATYCDITRADGSTKTEVGGQGLQTAHLGVDRLFTFSAPSGTTEVTCSIRGTGSGSGRFQVLATDGLITKVPTGFFLVAMISLGIGVAWGFTAGRRETTSK